MLDGRAAGHGQLINAALVAIGESEEPRRLFQLFALQVVTVG